MKPNKVFCVLLSSSVLYCGCYSYNSLSKDETVPNDKPARFQLKDGGLLESEEGSHSRVEGGYQVSGTLVRQDTLQWKGGSGVRRTVQNFSGMIWDADIEEITAFQYDGTSTVVAVVAGVSIVGIAVAVALADFHIGPVLGP